MDIADLTEIFVSPEDSIRHAMGRIDNGDPKIAIVVDKKFQLLDIITDGDVRRALLSNVDLDAPVIILQKRREESSYPDPITAHIQTDRSTLLRLMNQYGIRHIPLLNDQGHIVGLATERELTALKPLPLRAVVMAGGYGKRLRPLTEDSPKPMLPVGEKPLLELIIDQLRDSGVKEIFMTTHYKSEHISNHFKDGSSFGVNIQYLHEETPLGTAGALGSLDKNGDAVLVINGDVLTRVDFQTMFEFHKEHNAQMTVAVRAHEIQIPYGVIESEGASITRIIEKPVFKHFINAGIYILEPKVLDYTPTEKHYDMTDLIEILLSHGQQVLSFPIHEYWLDIGQIEDYHKAIEDMQSPSEA